MSLHNNELRDLKPAPHGIWSNLCRPEYLLMLKDIIPDENEFEILN